MSQAQEFEERVLRMVERNGLLHQILQNGTIKIFKATFLPAIHVSRAARPCRVCITFADGATQQEPWALLEHVCRNLAAGKKAG